MVLGIHREDVGWFGLAGFGLSLCLVTNGVFDGILSSRASAESFAVRISDDPLSGGIAIIAACLAAVLVLARTRREPRLRLAGACALAACQAVSLAALLLHNAGMVPSVAGEVGGLVLSASSVLLLALWAQAVARAGRARAPLVLACALLLDTVYDLASNALVDQAVVALSFMAALASPFALCALEGLDCPCAAPTSPESRGKGDLSLPLALACIAVYGFAMGRVQSMGSDFSATGLASLVTTYAVNLGALFGALLCVLITRLRAPHVVTRLVTLVTIVAALYFSGVFGAESGPAGMLMMSVARLFIFVYIWLMACDAAPGQGRTMLAFAAGWGVFTLANTVSTKLGLYVFDEGAGFVVYNVLMVVCLAALLAIEFVPRHLGARPGDPDANAASDGAAAPAQASAASAEEVLAASCQALADRFGLTEREREVLVPLVRGRSAASIASLLGMSTETARTHIRHIYQKTDIHSREELMDVIDDVRPAQ